MRLFGVRCLRFVILLRYVVCYCCVYGCLCVVCLVFGLVALLVVFVLFTFGCIFACDVVLILYLFICLLFACFLFIGLANDFVVCLFVVC